MNEFQSCGFSFKSERQTLVALFIAKKINTMSTSPTPTMPALVLASHHGALTPTWLPRPQPDAGQVLVRIHASGVNPLDTKIRAGAAEHAQQPLPAILGMDLAGVVEVVGRGVSRFQVGD